MIVCQLAQQGPSFRADAEATSHMFRPEGLGHHSFVFKHAAFGVCNVCRIELLEELCTQHGASGRAEYISQLATGCVDSETLQIANVLSHRPPEFQPGE